MYKVCVCVNLLPCLELQSGNRATEQKFPMGNYSTISTRVVILWAGREFSENTWGFTKASSRKATHYQASSELSLGEFTNHYLQIYPYLYVSGRVQPKMKLYKANLFQWELFKQVFNSNWTQQYFKGVIGF